MANSDLLKGLDEAEAARILKLGRRVLLTAGAQLFHLGDSAESIYLVMRGRLRLTLPMQVRDREEEVLLEEGCVGQAVGWSALIPPYRFTLTATALLETEVIAVPREALQEYFAGHAETGETIAWNLSQIIGQRLHLFQAMWLREIQRMVELRCA
jgi:CRP-like cAMP-binding protein